uniref:Kinesin-like protein KIF11-like n=1 Tax=Saccoglossus kowalevskii TaxID=10224 RepID=A0ABM0LXS0_SACKO|nr:PREDICTED: kinesin-like protein KIF11-like [Saccoglossus kowalevskii]
MTGETFMSNLTTSVESLRSELVNLKAKMDKRNSTDQNQLSVGVTKTEQFNEGSVQFLTRACQENDEYILQQNRKVEELQKHQEQFLQRHKQWEQETEKMLTDSIQKAVKVAMATELSRIRSNRNSILEAERTHNIEGLQCVYDSVQNMGQTTQGYIDGVKSSVTEFTSENLHILRTASTSIEHETKQESNIILSVADSCNDVTATAALFVENKKDQCVKFTDEISQDIRNVKCDFEEHAKAQLSLVQNILGKIKDSNTERECKVSCMERAVEDKMQEHKDCLKNQKSGVKLWTIGMEKQIEKRKEEVDRFITEELKQDVPTVTTPLT